MAPTSSASMAAAVALLLLVSLWVRAVEARQQHALHRRRLLPARRPSPAVSVNNHQDHAMVPGNYPKPAVFPYDVHAARVVQSERQHRPVADAGARLFVADEGWFENKWVSRDDLLQFPFKDAVDVPVWLDWEVGTGGAEHAAADRSIDCTHGTRGGLIIP